MMIANRKQTKNVSLGRLQIIIKLKIQNDNIEGQRKGEGGRIAPSSTFRVSGFGFRAFKKK